MVNKKADIGLGTIVVIIIVALFLGWLVREGWKECRVDADCKQNQYCTSAFECKDIPVIEKASPASGINSDYAAWIIGICLIIAAIIMRWDSVGASYRRMFRKNKGEHTESGKHSAESKAMYEDDLNRQIRT